MGGSVTVSVRGVVLTLVLALVALGAYLLGSTGGGSASAAVVPGNAVARTLTMSGKGEVTAVPDQLTFRLSVTQTRDDVAAALDASSATLRSVLTALEKQGVERKDTESTGLSIDPVYQYFDDQPPQIAGYRVRQSISVVVRSLRAGGVAVARAAHAGGNAVRVSDIKLRVGDPEALLAKARDAAVAAARDKAEQYAAATGQELGDVLTLREGHRPAKVRPLQTLASDAFARDLAYSKAVPLRSGRQDVSVAVSVVWQLA